MHIKPSDPRANYLAHKLEIDSAIDRALMDGHYILGPNTRAFEAEFAAYIGVPFGVAVASGTDALHLALRACSVGDGDEVITVSHTATATAAAIETSGATPVFVDIDLATFTLDPQQLLSALTPRTKAVVPVHLYGCPADMQPIMEVAQQYGLRVIEDCAQSHGARYGTRLAGSWGDAGIFSFYPTKNLSALGDGGIVVTKEKELAAKVALLREYGWGERYVSSIPGFNSRLDELQAAVLRVKLKYLEVENARRQHLATIYSQVLHQADLILPQCRANSSHVFHQYCIRSSKRDWLRGYLAREGIDTLIHYPVPIHQQPAYCHRSRPAANLGRTEQAAKEILSLPMYPEMTEQQVGFVAETILASDIAYRES